MFDRSVWLQVEGFDRSLIERNLSISSLYASGHPCTRAEQSAIKNELDALRSHKQKLQALLGSLASELEDTTEAISICEATLSPIRTLPQELLEAVFIAGTSCGAELPLNFRSWPWVLSQVCSRWRQTAISMGQLWRRVAYRNDGWIEEDFLEEHKFVLAVYRLWAERAGPGGIQLLDLGSNSMELVTSLRDHLTFLEIESRYNTAIGHGIAFSRLDTLSLEELSSAYGSIMDDFPSLRKLSLGYEIASDPGFLTRSTIPWHQLTHLRANLDQDCSEDVFVAQLQALRKASASLEELQLKYYGKSSDPAVDSMTKIIFPRLKKLLIDCLDTKSGEIAPDIPRSCWLLAPQLEELTVLDPVHSHWKWFEDLVNSSHCKLHTLRFLCTDWSKAVRLKTTSSRSFVEYQVLRRWSLN